MNFLGNILKYINPFSEDFLLKGVLDFLGNILSYINPFNENFIGYKFMELLSSLLRSLFEPDRSIIDEMLSNINEKFGFVNKVKTSVEEVKEVLTTDYSMSTYSERANLPKLELDINSKYYKGNLTIFDLSWYAPYKKYGDTILTAFIYIFFLWRLYIHLPATLHGLSGSISSIDKGNKEG